jgi:hypothetical protein
MSPRVGAYEVSSSTSSLSWPTPSPKIGATTPKWPAVVERRPFGDHARLAILSISVVCLTFMMANNSILYFTVLCMDAPAPAKDADGDKFQVYFFGFFVKKFFFGPAASKKQHGHKPADATPNEHDHHYHHPHDDH